MFPNSFPYVQWRDYIFPAQLTLREQALGSATTSAAGSGYALNDLIIPAGGTSSQEALLQVVGLSGSGVSSVAVINGGAYSVLPGNPLGQDSTSGSGSGATFNAAFDPTYLYSWTELAKNPDGTWTYAYPSPRTGNGLMQAALELNNNAVTIPSDTVGSPVYAWLRTGWAHGGADRRFEFIQAPTATGTSSTTLTYNNDTITYNDDVITINNSTTTLNSSTITQTNTRSTFIADLWQAFSLTINAPSGYYGGINIAAWLEICGNLALCCETVTFSTTPISDWLPPSPAVVYPFTATGSPVLRSIIPAAFAQVLQTTYPAHINSANTLTGIFPAATAGNAVRVSVWGQFAGSGSGFSVQDNLSNSFTQDVFTREPSSGLYAGIWHFLPSTGAASITFSYTGAAGKIVMVAEEVTNIIGVDTVGSATGTTNTPSPGSFTPAKPYEYLALTMASVEATNPATITPPSGVATDYQETNGAAYTVGSADAHASSATTTYTPTYTLDSAATWVAVGANYTLKPGPQLLVLVNRGDLHSGGPLFIDNQFTTSGGGKGIMLPPEYNDKPAALWTVGLQPANLIALWFDGCDNDWWQTVSCTVSPVGEVGMEGEPLKSSPHTKYTSVNGSVSITVTADPTNNQNLTDFSAVGAASITVNDSHGHSVANISTLTFLDGTNDTATVSGSAGHASVTINAASGGGGSSTLTTTDGTNSDTATSTITFDGGLTYTKGTGGSLHNDTVSLAFSGARMAVGTGISIPDTNTQNITFLSASDRPTWCYDIGGYFSSDTCTSCTVPVNGYYHIDGSVYTTSLDSSTFTISMWLSILSNRAVYNPGMIPTIDQIGYAAMDRVRDVDANQSDEGMGLCVSGDAYLPAGTQVYLQLGWQTNNSGVEPPITADYGNMAIHLIAPGTE